MAEIARTSNELPEHFPFSKLLPEIRFMIWEFSVFNTGRTITLQERDSRKHDRQLHAISSIVPTLFAVCRESRRIALKSYRVLFPNRLCNPVLFCPADTLIFKHRHAMLLALNEKHEGLERADDETILTAYTYKADEEVYLEALRRDLQFVDILHAWWNWDNYKKELQVLCMFRSLREVKIYPRIRPRKGNPKRRWQQTGASMRKEFVRVWAGSAGEGEDRRKVPRMIFPA